MVGVKGVTVTPPSFSPLEQAVNNAGTKSEVPATAKSLRRQRGRGVFVSWGRGFSIVLLVAVRYCSIKSARACDS